MGGFVVRFPNPLATGSELGNLTRIDPDGSAEPDDPNEPDGWLSRMGGWRE